MFVSSYIFYTLNLTMRESKPLQTCAPRGHALCSGSCHKLCRCSWSSPGSGGSLCGSWRWSFPCGRRRGRWSRCTCWWRRPWPGTGPGPGAPWCPGSLSDLWWQVLQLQLSACLENLRMKQQWKHLNIYPSIRVIQWCTAANSFILFSRNFNRARNSIESTFSPTIWVY